MADGRLVEFVSSTVDIFSSAPCGAPIELVDVLALETCHKSREIVQGVNDPHWVRRSQCCFGETSNDAQSSPATMTLDQRARGETCILIAAFDQRPIIAPQIIRECSLDKVWV